MIILDDATGKPITPTQAMMWCNKELKTIDRILKGGMPLEIKKELRKYRKDIDSHINKLLTILNREIK